MSTETNGYLDEFLQIAARHVSAYPDLQVALGTIRFARDDQPGPRRMQLVMDVARTLPLLPAEQNLPEAGDFLQLHVLLAEAYDLAEVAMLPAPVQLRIVDK